MKDKTKVLAEYEIFGSKLRGTKVVEEKIVSILKEKETDENLKLILLLGSSSIDWKKHLLVWDRLLVKNSIQVAHLVRKGIPSEIRGEAWNVISGAASLQSKNTGVYEYLLKQKSDVEDYLNRDINRTFPSHAFFNREGNGQKTLFNVLKVFSLLDSDVGYCQGMSYLCGVLVTQLNECDAFWVLTALLKTYNFRGLYLTDLPLLNHYLYRFTALISHFLPNLSSHFRTHGIQSLYYSSEWFSTLFSYNMDFDLTCRIWDIMFLEGSDYLFKVALAILKIYELDLLALDFEDIMLYLKNRTGTLDETLLKVADSFPKDLSIYWKIIDKKYEEDKYKKLLVESICSKVGKNTNNNNKSNNNGREGKISVSDGNKNYNNEESGSGSMYYSAVMART